MEDPTYRVVRELDGDRFAHVRVQRQHGECLHQRSSQVGAVALQRNTKRMGPGIRIIWRTQLQGASLRAPSRARTHRVARRIDERLHQRLDVLGRANLFNKHGIVHGRLDLFGGCGHGMPRTGRVMRVGMHTAYEQALRFVPALALEMAARFLHCATSSSTCELALAASRVWFASSARRCITRWIAVVASAAIQPRTRTAVLDPGWSSPRAAVRTCIARLDDQDAAEQGVRLVQAVQLLQRRGLPKHGLDIAGHNLQRCAPMQPPQVSSA